MKLPTREDAGEVRPVRTLILGSIMSAIPSLFGPYNIVVRNGSYLTIDFTTPAAVADRTFTFAKVDVSSTADVVLRSAYVCPHCTGSGV